MSEFRFAIMGAAHIANKFCDAVSHVSGCCVAAVASKSEARAKEFAQKNGISAFYDSYEEMLNRERPDCVYIATVMSSHYELAKLCFEHNTPVLCEKAMFVTKEQAVEMAELSRSKHLFLMEALWSRFLPANLKAKQWLLENKIGSVIMADAAIGFSAQRDLSNRFFDEAIGGGACYDLMVYNYDLMKFMLGQEIVHTNIEVRKGGRNVDVTEVITLMFTDTLATLKATFLSRLNEGLVLYGEKGRIVIPKHHMAQEAFLYDENMELVEHFTDSETKNGFTYEIEETVRCIRNGQIESEAVPHQMSIEGAVLYEQIRAKLNTALETKVV